PGCALAVDLNTQPESLGGYDATVISLYLPPDSRREVIASLGALSRPGTADIYVAGDINMQVHRPRDAQEGEDLEALTHVFSAWGLCMIPNLRHTRCGADSGVVIDIMAAPCQDVWRWTLHTTWHLGLSDHALCVASRYNGQAAAIKVCSPAALRALPSEAWADLRRRYFYLEKKLASLPTSLSP
ncbi:MAG: hypothetical protein ACKPKO_12600, partial [Candidatus Fonsibacter sp.]